jgi:hypothetical protein
MPQRNYVLPVTLTLLFAFILTLCTAAIIKHNQADHQAFMTRLVEDRNRAMRREILQDSVLLDEATLFVETSYLVAKEDGGWVKLEPQSPDYDSMYLHRENPAVQHFTEQYTDVFQLGNKLQFAVRVPSVLPKRKLEMWDLVQVTGITYK